MARVAPEQASIGAPDEVGVPRPVVTAVSLALVGAVVFVIRLTGAPMLLENEYRVGASVLDVLQHHNWLCPHDVLGNTDKPPLLTWLAALASLPGGRVTPLTLYLPTALATIASAWIVLTAAGRWFGTRIGFFAAFAYLLSHAAAEQMATARWDGLFTLTVAATAMLAFRAWLSGRGWTGVWLVAAAATLTKGPLALVLAGFGLLAVPWEGRSGQPRRLAGSHALGVLLYLVITVGWFALAYWQVGSHLIDNMIHGELIGNAVEHEIGYRFWKPIGDFIADLAPWSLLAIWGSYRIVTMPDPHAVARRFERFLFCWLWGGIVLFSVSPHTQARLLEPMMPAAAMLAGREVDRLTRRFGWSPVRFAAGATVVALGVFGVQYHRTEYRKYEVERTIAVLRLADMVRGTVGETFPLMYLDDNRAALQLALNRLYPTVSVDDAAALLRSDTAAFLVLADLAGLRRTLGADAPRLHMIAAATARGKPFLYLVGNRPRLTWTEPVATRVGHLGVTLAGVGLASGWGERLYLAPGRTGGVAQVENMADVPLPVVVHMPSGNQVRTLAPSERWRIEVPASPATGAEGL